MTKKQKDKKKKRKKRQKDNLTDGQTEKKYN